jgi:hypothetical protein
MYKKQLLKTADVVDYIETAHPDSIISIRLQDGKTAIHIDQLMKLTVLWPDVPYITTEYEMSSVYSVHLDNKIKVFALKVKERN